MRIEAGIRTAAARMDADHRRGDPGQSALHRPGNLATQWAISAEPAHPALVSEADFVAVQEIRTAPVPTDGSTRNYALTGLVFCGICGRAMDAHWTHGRAGYRCRHGRSSAQTAGSGQPRIRYRREDHLVALLQQTPALLRAHPRLRDATPHHVAAVLRRHDMILCGDHDGWTVETNNNVIALTARLVPTVLRAKIATQPGGISDRRRIHTFRVEITCPSPTREIFTR